MEEGGRERWGRWPTGVVAGQAVSMDRGAAEGAVEKDAHTLKF